MSTPTLHEMADHLILHMSNVADKDKNFCQSLCKSLHQNGYLSPKQGFWLGKMYHAYKDGATVALKPETVKVDVGNFSGVIALFNKAKESKLQYPALRLLVKAEKEGEAHKDVKLYVAGPNSQYHGHVMIVGAHKDWDLGGQNPYYGRVAPDGKFTEGKHYWKLGASLLPLLQALSQDPAGTAAEYGKLTGCCCFCFSPLTDEKSLAVGYGPTCAKKWGMPWGKNVKAPIIEVFAKTEAGKTMDLLKGVV